MRFALCVEVSMKLGIAPIVLFLGLAAPAGATPFTWIVEGHVTSVVSIPLVPNLGLFTVGQAFSWTLNLESDAQDFDPSPTCGFYHPIRSMSFSSGAVSFSASTPAQEYFVNPGGSCTMPLADVARIRTGSDEADLWFVMTLYGGFANDLLIKDPSVIAAGNVTFLLQPDSFAQANGTVDSIRLVPEPVTAALVGMGVIGYWRRRRSSDRG